MKPTEIIQRFDTFLAERGRNFRAVCIGGTALLGIVSRETQDCDILVPQIPPEVKRLSEEFAAITTDSGIALQKEWLNNGRATLTRDLPPGWEQHVVTIFQGRALTLQTLGRADLLKSKLFALCDRAVDHQDCLRLDPIREELLELLPWLEQRDGNPQWPEHVKNVLDDLARERGYEL
jgi:hypothetical protein